MKVFEMARKWTQHFAERSCLS